MNTAIIETLTVFFDAKSEIILAMLYGSCVRGTETEKSVKKKQGEGSGLLHRHTMTALYWYADYYPIYKRGQRYILEHAFKRNLVGNVQ